MSLYAQDSPAQVAQSYTSSDQHGASDMIMLLTDGRFELYHDEGDYGYFNGKGTYQKENGQLILRHFPDQLSEYTVTTVPSDDTLLNFVLTIQDSEKQKLVSAHVYVHTLAGDAKIYEYQSDSAKALKLDFAKSLQVYRIVVYAQGYLPLEIPVEQKQVLDQSILARLIPDPCFNPIEKNNCLTEEITMTDDKKFIYRAKEYLKDE